MHIDRLTQLEYVLVHRGGRGQSFEYELLYESEGQHGETFLMGLLDVEQLKNQKTLIREEAATTTESSRGKSTGFAVSKRPQNGGIAAPSRREENAKAIEKSSLESDSLQRLEENARPAKNSGASYRTDTFPLAAVAAVDA